MSDLDFHAEKSVEFIKKHFPQAHAWVDPLGWAKWYISNGFMSAMHRDDGTIAALACARPVNRPEDGYTAFKHANDGPCIYVDFLAIEERNPLTLTAFAMLLASRFGTRKTIAYSRLAHHDYERFLVNLSKKKTIGEPSYG